MRRPRGPISAPRSLLLPIDSAATCSSLQTIRVIVRVSSSSSSSSSSSFSSSSFSSFQPCVSSTITTSSAATNSRHATRRVHPRDLEGSTFDRAPLQTRSNSSSKRRSPSIRGSSKRERSTTIGDSIDLPLHFAPAEVLGGQSTGRNQA